MMPCPVFTADSEGDGFDSLQPVKMSAGKRTQRILLVWIMVLKGAVFYGVWIKAGKGQAERSPYKLFKIGVFVGVGWGAAAEQFERRLRVGGDLVPGTGGNEDGIADGDGL